MVEVGFLGLLRIENLGKRFSKVEGKWVFRHLHYCFPDKGLYLIFGPSGCGKSTLLSILAGLAVPTEGKVYFQNKAISSMGEEGLSKYRGKGIGLVFQHYNLLEGLTSKENINLASLISCPSGKPKKAEELLESVGLKEKGKQSVDTLSGGEKQRVAICRAMINSPKVLFCDEPTGALDKKNSILIMDLLSRISKQALVVVVSHDIELTLPYADGTLDLGAL